MYAYWCCVCYFSHLIVATTPGAPRTHATSASTNGGRLMGQPFGHVTVNLVEVAPTHSVIKRPLRDTVHPGLQPWTPNSTRSPHRI